MGINAIHMTLNKLDMRRMEPLLVFQCTTQSPSKRKNLKSLLYFDAIMFGRANLTLVIQANILSQSIV